MASMASGNGERLHQRAWIAWKWLISFLTTDWELRDYPVVVRKQDEPVDHALHAPRFEPQPYWASVPGANLGAGGETAADAMENLRSNFQRWKRKRLTEGKGLPRPGTRVPMEFAASTNVDAHGALTADFVHRVLQLDWAMITDESSLWDFHTEQDNARLIARVKDLYGVDVSDVASGNLSAILDRIAAHRLEMVER